MSIRALWLSRHDMTDEQKADLERIYPSCEIVKLDQTADNVQTLLEWCKGFDVLAAVLPIELLCELMKLKPDGLRVIFARSERVKTEKTVLNPATGGMDSEYLFRFDGWREIVRLDCEITNL